MNKASLLAIMPRMPSEYGDILIKEMGLADINTILRQSAFLAQIAHESSECTRVEENMNYSAERLMIVFKRHFPDRETADKYARQPEKIGNKVYSNRMGNGDEASGDGFRYHGRGLIQLTGKDNYRWAAYDMKEPLLEHPELLIQPEYAVRSAVWWWHKNNINPLADTKNFELITKRINGGLLGQTERVKYYEKAIKVLVAEETA